MEFEFDPAKSQRNQAKHKIDFVDAQALWSDQAGVEIKLNFKDEQRFARIAKRYANDKAIWTAIFTLRSENIRLISVRRARDKEKQEYGKSANSGRI